MPILLPPDPDKPLCQGDVLDEIVTYVTDLDGKAAALKPGAVLVLSRPCNALRKKDIVVAPVVKNNKALSSLNKSDITYDEVMSSLVALRDGLKSPDNFYLGTLGDGSTDRFFAKLDALHTIQIPEEESPRRAFLSRHRRFRLDQEFARDLHLRVFNAFARLGFDDHGWWATADLEIVLMRGDAAAMALQAQVAQKKSERAMPDMPSKATEQLSKDIDKLETDQRKLQQALAPLREELGRRAPSSPTG